MEICGYDARTDRPYTYYLAPEKDIRISMCVSECPNITGQDICLYKTDKSSNSATTEIMSHFCNSTLESKRYGKFCFPY